VKNQNVGLGELRSGGEGQAAGDFETALGEKSSPLTEELRILVGAGGLGFFAGADKNAEGVGGVGVGLEGAGAEEKQEGDELSFHDEFLSLGEDFLNCSDLIRGGYSSRSVGVSSAFSEISELITR